MKEAFEFLLLIIIALLSYTLGYMFTETKYDLQKYKLFQFKAFACRKCLTFHIMWVTGTFASLLLGNWVMIFLTFFIAGMMFLGLFIDEQEKFNKGKKE